MNWHSPIEEVPGKKDFKCDLRRLTSRWSGPRVRRENGMGYRCGAAHLELLAGREAEGILDPVTSCKSGD